MTNAPSYSSNRIRFGVSLITWASAASLLLSACIPGRADARENPMLLLLRNAVYGSACGLLLGGVLTLVVDSDSRGEVVRWGIVVGTFTGFGYGIYELSTGGGGYQEFTRRDRADTYDELVGRVCGTAANGAVHRLDTIPVPLSPLRALGRPAAIQPLKSECGQLMTRLGSSLSSHGQR